MCQNRVSCLLSPSTLFRTKNCTDLFYFRLIFYFIWGPTVPKSETLFTMGNKGRCAQWTRSQPISIPLFLHHTTFGSADSVWISFNIAPHPSRCTHNISKERHSAVQTNQIGNQPLNQICNLTLSTTHHWIPLNFDLVQSGLESNCIHIQISIYCVALALLPPSICLAPGESVCSQSSDGNHT